MQFDEASDAWWSGAQMNFASVAKAGAALALSTSVAIAGGFKHQDDLEKFIVGGADSQLVIAIGEDLRQAAFHYNEEFSPRINLDQSGDEWARQLPPVRVTPTPIWFTDEPVSPAIAEEMLWQAPTAIIPRPTIITFSYDDEPVQVAGAIFEENEWQGFSPYFKPTLPLIPTDADFPPPAFVDDEQGLVAVGRFDPPKAQAFMATDELVAQPAAFVPEEDYWFQLKGDRTEISIVQWPGPGGGNTLIAPVAPLQIVEEDWRVFTPAYPKPAPLYQPDPETEYPSLTAPPVTSDFAGGSTFTHRRVHKMSLVPWYQSDELPAFSLRPEEEYWQLVTPPPPKPLVTLYADEDLIVPQPLPLPFDEEPWSVWTPPLTKPLAMFLPDPEEIPAGSLVPGPDVTPAIDGHYPKGGGLRPHARKPHPYVPGTETAPEEPKPKAKPAPKAPKARPVATLGKALSKAALDQLPTEEEELAFAVAIALMLTIAADDD